MTILFQSVVFMSHRIGNNKFYRKKNYLAGRTIFALGDVAAFISALGVGGVAPRADPVPVWISAVVQLQTVGGCGSPPETDREFPSE